GATGATGADPRDVAARVVSGGVIVLPRKDDVAPESANGANVRVLRGNSPLAGITPPAVAVEAGGRRAQTAPPPPTTASPMTATTVYELARIDFSVRTRPGRCAFFC